MDGYRDRVRGALLGGAIGDALGWPVEFLRLDQIREQHGPAGQTGGPHATREVTDDTQMTLFTAEGLIRAQLAGVESGPELYHAYRRWFLTQQQSAPDAEPLPSPYDGWLLRQPFLYARRAPGQACWTGSSRPTSRPRLPGSTARSTGTPRGAGR